MSNRDIRNQFTSKPSSTRVRGEVSDARQRQDQLLDRFGNPGPATKEERDSRPSRMSTADKVYLGGLSLIGAATLAVGLANFKGDPNPVNVNALPKSEVTTFKVPVGGSHYPSGIAGNVINNDADLGQVTAEIQNEVEGADTVPTGTVLELPTDQIDPAAVQEYQANK